MQFEVVAITEGLLPALQHLFGLRRVTRQQRAADVALATAGQRDQTLRVFVDPCRAHHRDAAVLVFEVAFRDQARNVQVAVVVLAQQRHAVRQRLLVIVTDPGIDADDRLDARTQRRAGELDHREQIALVG